ncbi:hypothetical protein TcG_11392 [Trypanosoma cruzi]|nr:hypothetical protein TcG_11392 [Trypanosoma cruzi]
MFTAEHFLCGSRHPQSVPSAHPSRGAAISATPASSRPQRHPAAPCHQFRRSRGAPSQTSRHSSSPSPPKAPCHGQHHVSIGNTILQFAMCGWQRVREIKLTGKVHGASDWTAILQRGAPQRPHTARHSSHALRCVRIGNTSGTMLIRHREPTANAARGKWRHNQRTLQWLYEQTIRMQFDSTKDCLLCNQVTVCRGQNTILTVATVNSMNLLCNAKRSRSASCCHTDLLLTS